MRDAVRFLAIGAVVLACAWAAQAVDIQTVTVGNPGNADDTHGDGYGGVGYVYRIGTFEVTAGQYTEFLNAVAATDTYGLYNSNMWSNIYGCKIQQDCSAGPCSYTVALDWADRPVNYVSWGDAARFCNWLHNGQPTGAQDLSTTEDGSYYLNGATSDPALMAVLREEDATWVIPSEDEWYKAAYHYNDGVTGNYYDYPTSSDSVPSNDLIDPDPGNNANFVKYFADYTIGSPYWRTEVGDFENSESPYNTFDQGGNVWEWNETVIAWPNGGLRRGARGGSFYSSGYLPAADRWAFHPSFDDIAVGFRVAQALTPDADGDGVPDDVDVCPDSDLGESIIIDACDTAVGNDLFDDGCTMADRIVECAAAATTHGEFVSCVAQLTNDWNQEGLISGQDKGRIQSCAVQGDLWSQCQTDADCDDGLFCNGVEVCLDGACVVGDPCPGQSCNETTDECVDQ